MQNKLLKFATKGSVWILTLAIVIGVFSLTGTLVQAWNGTLATAFASGSGTQSNPYVIRTEGQLGYFAKQMNAGVTYEGLYIKLSADLNTTGNTWAYDNTSLTPEFKGSFDGQCYTITTDCPIFPKIGTAGTVQKLNAVAGSAFDGDSILTVYNAGLIQACTARGTISGGASVGLICSDNYGTVQYCGAVGAASASGDDCDAYAGMVGMNKGVVDRCFAAVACSAYASGKYNDPYTCPLGNGEWGSRPHTVTDSYYDKTLSPGAFTKGIGLTTTEMKSAAFLLEFSGNTVSGARWIKGSDGYPTLAAASTSTVTISGWDGAKTQVFGSAKSITLVRSGSGTTYYTTDGTDPQTSSTRKSSSSSTVTFSISKDTVVTAVVYYSNKYSTPIRVQYVYMPGSGTEADPYRISSKLALEAIRQDTEACYVLTTDLTYNDSDFAFGGVAAGGWTPFSSFTGKLDGAGYAIYNLEGNNGGLIDSNSGTVTSLRMIDHDLFRGGRTGPIANTNYGTITKCYAKSAWTLNSLPSAIEPEYQSYSGGIAGYNNGTISQCSTEGIVVGRQVTDDGDHYIGGIFGGGGEAHACMSRALIVTQGAENFIYAGGISGLGYSYDCWTDVEFYVDSRINYDAYFGGTSGYHYARWSDRCVVDTFAVTQSSNAYIRKYTYTWSSSCSQDNYLLSKTAQPEAFPALDFENTWMITEDGVVPRGVMDADGHCYDMQSYTAPTCTTQGISVLKCTMCGNTKQCVVSEPVHKSVVDTGTPATCTQDGLTDGAHCSVCSKVLTPQTTLTALGHSFTSYVSDNNAACTVDGTETAKCDRCEEKDTRVVKDSRLGHTYDQWTVLEPASCLKIGLEYARCTVCTQMETRDIPIGDHAPAAAVRENAVESTCEAAGSYESVVYCSVCSDELSRNLIGLPIAEHKYESVFLEGSCEAAPKEVYTCTACTYTYSKEIGEPLGHKAGNWTVTQAPTCTQAGSEQATCTRCPYVFTREIAPSHTPGQFVQENVVEVTCTVPGSYDAVVYCSVCDEELSREQQTVPSPGHQFTNWIVSEPSTCIKNGVEYARCDVCREATVRDLPIGDHTPGTAVQENVVAPGCTADGSFDLVVYCVYCEDELSREQNKTAMLGHTIQEARETPTCTKDGRVIYTCANCSYYREEALSAPGHTPGEAVQENRAEPTCTADGSYEEAVYCAVCDEALSRQSKPIAATGHKFGEAVVVPAAPGVEGYSYHICSVCKLEEKFGFADALPLPSGDIDGNAEVDADDAIALLLYISMPDQYPLNASADINGDGYINTDDAIVLLLHISLPDLFPLPAGKEEI